jgi:G3E family GTPase
MLPLLVITGFLGAGKTSLLRELIPRLEENGITPRVILNDHQNARVDASSLQAPGRAIQPLSGHCVCCDSLDSLREALAAVPDAPHQAVLLEASGSADPGTLLTQLAAAPEIRTRFAPIIQVTLVNAHRWQKRFWHNELERLQVRTASHILMTWIDRVEEARRTEVRTALQKLNPRATQSDATALLDLLRRYAEEPAASPATTGSKPAYFAMTPEHTLSHDFVATTLTLPALVQRDDLMRWIDALPPEILRVKAIGRFQDEPDAEFLVEKTDDHKWGATAFRINQPSGLDPVAILIGVQLDHQTLQAQADALATESRA